jgi:dynamin 1-like protein
MEIFPTGKGIVTRTPIHLEMVNMPDLVCTKIEFGENKQGSWIVDTKLDLSLEPSKEELQKIREEIKKQTCKRAGSRLGISETPIFIKIMSPKVHDLTIVDLPGIAMIANIEEGQPDDIEDQLKKMIGKYIISDRAIILVIIPATGDVEADTAVSFIKKFDPMGKRTIGVFTKIDLMNKDTDVSKYISGHIPQNLKFAYGYYAVKNRTPKECESISISGGVGIEKTYLSQHPVYGKLSEQNRLGIESLIKALKTILVEKIRINIPEIIKEIKTREYEIDELLKTFGPSIPSKPEEQLTRLSMLVSEFCQRFKSKFDDNNSGNIGRRLKEIFDDFRDNVTNINPFTKEQCSDEYIINIMKNCQGNHMSSPVPTINILEKCLKDPSKKIILRLKEPSENCVKNIQTLIMEIINSLLSLDTFARFHKLVDCIKEEIMSKLLPKLYEKTMSSIEDSIKSEEYYQWTDDQNFKQLLESDLKDQRSMIENQCFSKAGVQLLSNDGPCFSKAGVQLLSNDGPCFSKAGVQLLSNDGPQYKENKQDHPLRILLSEYYNIVKMYTKNTVVKIIMYKYVREAMDGMFEILFAAVTKHHIVSSLLSENQEQVQKRAIYEMQKEKLVSARKLLGA